MYSQVDFLTFMSLVTEVNTHFERYKTSSLRPLIDLLGNKTASALQVSAALTNLPAASQSKYWKALLHLRLTYTPKLTPVTLAGGLALGKMNAAKFKRNPTLPLQWQTDFAGQQGANKLYQPSIEKEIPAASNAFLGKSLEHYILENPLNVGGVLIHLGGYVDALNCLIERKSHFDHLVSVLQVLNYVGAPLCVLHQRRLNIDEGSSGGKVTEDVCSEFRPAVSKFGARVTSAGETQHAGGKESDFQDFIRGHDTIIAMGYDGDVCVGANCFGTPELNKPDILGKQTLVVPIIHLADIVTSRAVLVSGNPLNKVDKWGVLFKT